MNDQHYINYLAHMLDEAFLQEDSEKSFSVIDNPPSSAAESYLEDLTELFRKLPFDNKKSQNFKSSAEFALGDLHTQFEDLPKQGGIAFAVEAFNNTAVAGTTYINFTRDVGGCTSLVSFEKGQGKALLEFLDKKFKGGFCICPISKEVSDYYKSILKFDDIEKDKFLISSKASRKTKEVFKKLGPRIEGLSEEEIEHLQKQLF